MAVEAKTPSLAETIADSGLAISHARRAARPQLTSSSGDRQLLQERVALFGAVSAALSTTSLVILVGSHLVAGFYLSLTSTVFHVAGIAAPLATWIIGRGPPRSERALRLVDELTTFALALCFSVMSASLPRFTRPEMMAAMIILLTTTARATLVPSSPRRTFVISVLAWVPVFIVAYLTYRDDGLLAAEGRTEPFRIESMIESTIWTVLGTTLVTVTSRVIYGLRREVREAQKLGQYTLLEKLGEGGMGQVFRAQHAMLRRPTAVKLLHPDRTGGAEDLARFEREVQLTAQLSHPNVVTVFDYGRTPDGVFYYAMELLEGQNLQDIVEQSGPMTPARAVHVLTQVASALAEAHAVGLIHRDIKPANIILCARGRTLDVAKVVDFGLVKDLGAVGDEVAALPAGASLPPDRPGSSGSRSRNGASASVSRTGTILGTPMYLAPEAMRDPTSVDGRADLYALGAVAYFLLTGTVVFGGKSVMDACRHHLHSTPQAPSARLNEKHQGASIPADVEAIVLKCLAKKPTERPANAQALLEALLACSSAGAWTNDDARAWWQKRSDRPPATTGTPSETSWSAKTIAVDLAR
jgi:eukaryotic-like serine/threonine-protein kinase